MHVTDHALETAVEDMESLLRAETWHVALTDDQLFRDEMAVCRAYQIPHGTFQLWPPADQAKAIAYERFLRETCTRCNTRDDEWRETVDGKVRDINPPPYEPVLRSCAGCETVASLLEEEKELEPGIYVALKRVS